MKQVLINALISLVTGLCFCLGAGIAIYALTEYDGSTSNRKLEYLRYPPELRVKDVVQVAGAPKLLLRGTVENLGTSKWQPVEVEALIKVDGAQVNRCEEYIGDALAPKGKVTFEIECKDATGSNLPAGLTYDVRVSTAAREPVK